MITRFPMFPWERANARIGLNLIPVDGELAEPCSVEVSGHWLDENEALRKDFVRFARMTGASRRWREQWAREHPDEWVRWEAAWERGEWHPEGWHP